MNKKILFGRSAKDLLLALGPSVLLICAALFLVYRYLDPAPPNHIVITTGDAEGDYQTYAKLYKDILKEDGIDLEIRPSIGALENLRRLEDPKSDVDVGFVQDGLGSSDEAPELISLGSLYYEPLWIFYRGRSELTRFSQLIGHRIAIGQKGGGTGLLAARLLKSSGVDESNSRFVHLGWQEAALALRNDQVDAAFFLATPEDPLIDKMLADGEYRLMSVDQAEATTRKYPFLHHLVLPHGAIDLRRNLPGQDVHLVSPTSTLIVRDSLHPALIYLLLKAAAQVHNEPGIFEKKDEFPIDKDYTFPLSDDAKRFYRSGAPFWQRYLPFWIATLVDRFILIMLPLMALLFPMIKLIPRVLDWRVRSRILQRYGELKFLETQLKAEKNDEKFSMHMSELDRIEERVNQMKVPLGFSEHLYVLREHIHFVRGRLARPSA